MSVAAVARARDPRVLRVQADVRPCVRAKFIFVGNQKFFIKGVTYGAFRPNDAGVECHDPGKIRRDFQLMASNGINTVRIQHTTPPVHLLDIAAEDDLRVMVGLSAEQHVGHLLDGNGPAKALSGIRSKVRSCMRHPALAGATSGSQTRTQSRSSRRFPLTASVEVVEPPLADPTGQGHCGRLTPLSLL